MIPVLLCCFCCCLSLSAFAAEKVYTNKDLHNSPSLNRHSRIDPATGKVIKDTESASRSQTPKGLRGTVLTITTKARHQATVAMDEIARNKIALVAVVGLPLIMWLACLIDILRNEFRGNNKLIWFIAVTFVPVVGCILYLFIGIRQRKYRFIRDYE